MLNNLSNTTAFAKSGIVRPIVSLANPQILTIAHRGVWENAPENSLAAIRDAVTFGVEIVEIDAQATADGTVVVIHDETIDRTSTGSGTVSELAFADLRRARLKAGAGGDEAAVTADPVPTLAEALEEARGRIAVNIDTKYERDLDAVMAVVLDLGMADQVIMKSVVDPESGWFDILRASWFGKVSYMPIFRACPDCFAQDLRRIESLGVSMVEIKFDRLEDIAAAREELERQAIRVWVNTLDVSHNLNFHDTRALVEPDHVWGTLIDAGVGAIQTDSAPALKTWLSQRGARNGSAK